MKSIMPKSILKHMCVGVVRSLTPVAKILGCCHYWKPGLINVGRARHRTVLVPEGV